MAAAVAAVTLYLRDEDGYREAAPRVSRWACAGRRDALAQTDARGRWDAWAVWGERILS
ncbi:MAG: hypothetical protein NVSMB65_17580 [Chloroflexota bacterium]